MNQEGRSKKNKKVTSSKYVSAGSLTSLKNLLQGTRKIVQSTSSKYGKQQFPPEGSQVQAQVHQVPPYFMSPVVQELLEQVKHFPLDSSFSAAQKVHKEVQQVPLDSTNRIAQEVQKQVQQAISKNEQQVSLHSTYSATQKISKNEKQVSMHSTSPATQKVSKNEKQVPMRSTSPATQKESLHFTSSTAKTVLKKGQQLSLRSNSSPTQAVPENEQQVPLDTATHETNEQSAEQGPSIEKKKRGGTRMQSVHGRTERKLIVLNELNQPIGPTVAVVQELSSFLGTLARNSTFCPLTIKTWKKVNTKKDMWKYIKEKYDIPDVGQKWALKTIQDAWRTYKSRLKRRHYKCYPNDEVRVKNRPNCVSEAEFKALLDYWNSDEAQKISRTNIENRKKLKHPHTVEKRSFALIREEKKKETAGVVLRKDIFVATRSRKSSRVYKESHDNTIHKIAEMEKIQTQESEDGAEPVDAFASVMGPEHPGRVRLYGRGATKTALKEKVGDPVSSTDELLQRKIEEIEERMKQRMVETFKEQKGTMEQEIAINIITRLQCLNPELRLDSDMLAFCARSSSSRETEGQYYFSSLCFNLYLFMDFVLILVYSCLDGHMFALYSVFVLTGQIFCCTRKFYLDFIYSKL